MKRQAKQDKRMLFEMMEKVISNYSQPIREEKDITMWKKGDEVSINYDDYIISGFGEDHDPSNGIVDIYDDEAQLRVAAKKYPSGEWKILAYEEQDEFDLDENLNEQQNRPLYEIAQEIRQDWRPVHAYAKPYLDAMLTLDSIDDNYMFDSAKSIVSYFLSNANMWRGEKAKEIKKELKSMIGLKEHTLEEYKYPDNAETYQKLLDTAQKEGHITAQEAVAEYVTVVAKEIATEFDSLGLDVHWDRLYKEFLTKINKIGSLNLKLDESGYEDYIQRYQERLKEMNTRPELLKHVTIDQVNKAAAEEDIETIDTIYELLFNKA